MRAWRHVLTNITTDRGAEMMRIDLLCNRVVEIKTELNRQNIVDRLNRRHKEDLPPLFWVCVVVIALLIMNSAA